MAVAAEVTDIDISVLSGLFIIFPHWFYSFALPSPLFRGLEVIVSEGQNRLTEKPLLDDFAVHKASASFWPDC